MRKRFYIDTSVWRDFLGNRTNGLRPLGEFAFLFLRNCRENSCEIIVSNTVIEELEIVLSLREINKLFEPFEKAIVRVEVQTKQIIETREKWLKPEKELSFNDVLHAIIARDCDAVLVSRDRHFFELLVEIVAVKKPEEIIFD